ncbi:MAG: hypothetical protein H7Y30_08035 [Pyrinomonadaceae bacterium]|nr:hypothetical protein [Pyrinomonadaceae bacterium]
MRIGILAASLPAAARIYSELESLPDCSFYTLVCNPEGRSLFHHLARSLAQALLKPERRRTWRLIRRSRISFIRKPLDHPDSLTKLKRLELDVGLHNVGVIYRDSTIKAFRLGILNPHIGILPQYRGRCVMEWAVLQDGPIGVTLFFIDAGIDTGARVILSEEVDISHCKSVAEAKQYLFNLDAGFFRRGLEQLRAADFSYKLNDGSGHRYYVMSELLQGVVEQLIRVKK